MNLQLPHSVTKKVSDTSLAEIKRYRGSQIIVIDNSFFMDYNLFNYKQFCKDAGYCNYTDMLPEDIHEEYIFNNESLLAYAYFNSGLWQDINKVISYHYKEIAELSKLKGEL
jgi:L-rhamnose isomerase